MSDGAFTAQGRITTGSSLRISTIEFPWMTDLVSLAQPKVSALPDHSGVFSV